MLSFDLTFRELDCDVPELVGRKDLHPLKLHHELPGNRSDFQKRQKTQHSNT